MPLFPSRHSVSMPRGSPTDWRSGIASSLNSLTLQPDTSFTIPHSHNSSDGESEPCSRPGGPVGGGSSGQLSGTLNAAHFGSRLPNQRTTQNEAMANPDQFDDTPYVPPRVPQVFSAPDAHLNYAFDPRGQPRSQDVQQQYPYEGGTSPSDSQHSVESNWSTSSSSSASSRQHLPQDYYGSQSSSQYSQSSLPQPLPRYQSYQPHYPAYHGQHRLGLEHVRYIEQSGAAGGDTYLRLPAQGYSIDGLLAPEVFEDAQARVVIPSQISHPSSSQGSSSSSSSIPMTNRPENATAFSVSPSTLSTTGRSLYPDAGPYLRQQLGLASHEPVGLSTLPDPPYGEKPATPLPMLIKLAIYGSPSKQLTLQEIYNELENRFQWFRDHRHEKAWKNSIRHNLSLNKVFRHVPRPITEPGKGSYWQLDVSGGEGYKRTRKRRPKNSKLDEDEDEDEDEMDEEGTSPSDYSQVAGPSRVMGGSIDDTNIDPDLRDEGHVVGLGRTRSRSRRAGVAGGPYAVPSPSQSPRYQQGQLTSISDPRMGGVLAQDTSAQGQSAVRFGQPSFGQTSFVQPYAQSRPGLAASSAFAASSTTALAQSTPSGSRPAAHRAATAYDRNTHAIQPPARPGVEYVRDYSGLPNARRTHSYPQYQADTRQTSPDSASSGSSQTWNPDPKDKSNGRMM